MISDPLDQIITRCEGAYAANTLIGYRSDCAIFRKYCLERGLAWLPAEAQTVAAFVDHQAKAKCYATIRRHLEAINFMHRIAERPVPTEHIAVKLALKRAGRSRRKPPKQALGMTSDLLSRIVEACPDTLVGLRDAALLAAGYDTLCRASELVAIHVEHLHEGNTQLVIPYSKTDPLGEGRTTFLSAVTRRLLAKWLAAAQIDQGPVFRGLSSGDVSAAALHVYSVNPIIKKAAARAGLGEAVVKRLSSHSLRVGAAQDMLCAGVDVMAIMQAGGWRSYRILARYVEHASAQQIHRKRWSNLRSFALDERRHSSAAL